MNRLIYCIIFLFFVKPIFADNNDKQKTGQYLVNFNVKQENKIAIYHQD